jgi:hypothetical protein
MQNGRRQTAAAQVYWEKRAKDGDGNRPSSASYYMHLPGPRASRCPQEGDLFRRPQLQFLWVLPGTHYVQPASLNAHRRRYRAAARAYLILVILDIAPVQDVIPSHYVPDDEEGTG